VSIQKNRDRLPWLQTLHQLICEWIESNTNVILACSALRFEYRHWLQLDDEINTEIKWVYLEGSFALIQQRIRERQGHFMQDNLLQNQFDLLEIPEDAVHVDISATSMAIVEQIRNSLSI